jgi:hypothetical protein
MYFLRGLRVCMTLKALLYSSNDESPQHQSILMAIHNLNSPKNYICLLGGCCLSMQRACMERKASCGVLGGHFCQRRSWLAMVVWVDVGRWRLTSDQPTVGIVKIVYGFFFEFLCISYTLFTSDPSAKLGKIRLLHL